MAATRTYYRDSKGRYAGSSGGRAEVGKSGGFANATHRSRVGSQRAKAQSGQRLSRKSAGSRTAHVQRKSGFKSGARNTAKQVAGAAVLLGAVQSSNKGLRAASTAAIIAASMHGNYKFAKKMRASTSQSKRVVGRR